MHITGQLGHRPSSPDGEDDQQTHVAQFVSSPQVVKMFKGDCYLIYSSFFFYHRYGSSILILLFETNNIFKEAV
jgi:hypothetical protein